ncbi:MAG: alginate export family protein [Myxococcota bacterium]
MSKSNFCMEKFRTALAITLSLSTFATVTHAEETANKSTFDTLLSAITQGKPILDVNFRWENGKADGLQTSNSLTARTRLGYQTSPIWGLQGLLEFENIASPYSSGYFDAVEVNQSGQTPVADPETIAANRFWLRFAKKEWAGLDVKVGRQRIKLDDDRWIGNVGWRQNEQTYDSVRGQTNFGVDGLLAQYIYAWEVNRIFGDQGPANRRDFGQNSHFINLSYQVAPELKAVGFAYLLDTNDPFAGFASNTYGFRLNGKVPVNEKFAVVYQGSYAYQTDAADNPVDYGAHYALAEVGLAVSKIATFAAGYELLGTDDGDARVVTPFSTAHKFNGFADVFLNNGGNRGLRDVWASVAPAIPVKGVKLKFVFHQFYDDQGGDNLGQEYDVVGSYKLNKYISFLYKLGYFDGGKDRSPPTTVRNILQTTFKF